MSQQHLMLLATTCCIYLICILTTKVRLVEGGCNRPNLPTDLDLISSVEKTDYRELHLHGMYRIGQGDPFDTNSGSYDHQVHNLTLSYTEKTEMRVSISLHDAATLELILVDITDDTQPSIVARSQHGGTEIEKMIFAILAANQKYVLVFRYSLGFQLSKPCPAMMMELAVQPKAHVVNVNPDSSDLKQPPQIPNIAPALSEKWYFSHKSEVRFANVGGDLGDDDFRLIEKYPITVPHIPARHQQWKLHVVLHSRFLDGGDLAMMVTPSPINGPDESSTPPSPTDCRKEKSICFYGLRSLRNQMIIQEQLWAGDKLKDGYFTLWLMRRKPEPTLDRSYVPYSLDVTLHPLQEQETFLSCDINPLPPTFNAPGFYDDLTGIMVFRQSVLVNLTQRDQSARIKTSKPKSILRVWISSHDTLDVDLLLFEVGSTASLAASVKMRGPEGLVYQLSSEKEYKLAVSIPWPHKQYDGKDHDYFAFCDSFDMHAHIYPISDTDETCVKTPDPNLDHMQSQILDQHSFTFEMPIHGYQYRYALSKENQVSQVVLFEKTFYTPTLLYGEFVVPSDNYAGRVVLELELKGSGQKKYSQHRAVGSGLHARLLGEYTLRILSPYVQHTSKSWKEVAPDLPTCLQYSLLIKIKENDDCVVPLPLPSQLQLGPHNHHHTLDEYQVAMNGWHFVSVTSSKSAVLHVRVVESDVPVTMLLIPGTVSNAEESDAVAKSHDPSNINRPELFYGLTGDQHYALKFVFNLQGVSTSSSCLSVTFEISLRSIVSGLTAKCPKNAELLPPLKHIKIDEFGEIGPVSFGFKPSTVTTNKESLNWQDGHVVLEFEQAVHLRLELRYDFAFHGFGLILCKVENDDCYAATPFYNGLNYATTMLMPGNYSLDIQPWSHAVGTGNEDITKYCALMSIEIAVFPIQPKKSASLCPHMMQYLPHSFNHVDLINSYYKEEMHFQQDVLLSTQHLEDHSTLNLEKKSVLRAFAPHSDVLTTISIYSSADKKAFHHTVGGAGMYYELEPGSYEFVVRYFINLDQLDELHCISFPLEVSIVQSKSIDKLSVASGECENSPAFPTVPFHHGHQTLYRVPATPFNKQILFQVGERGGDIDFDIRYNFETSGLAVSLEGVLKADDGSKNKKKFTWTYFSDRAYISTWLEHGDYSLEVLDPSLEKQYDNAPSADCIPYSIHLRFHDNGGFSTATVNPSSSGEATWGPAVGTFTPQLQCDNLYQMVPGGIVNANTQYDEVYRMKKENVKIPFENGYKEESDAAGMHLRYTTTTKSISLYAFAHSTVRFWVRSEAKVLMVVLLFKGNQTEPLAVGKFFGLNTQTLLWQDSLSESKTELRLDIKFVYKQAPQYQMDYDTCDEKKKMTSVDMYLAVFSNTHVRDASDCSNIDDLTHHYPQATMLIKEPQTLEGNFYFTESDMSESSLAKKASGLSQNAKGFFSFESSSSNVTIVVPPGGKNGKIIAHLRYPLDVANMRMELRATNQSRGLSKSDGSPLRFEDETYSAGAELKVDQLGPGTYHLLISEHNAEQESQYAAYCIPYHLRINVEAENYGSGGSTPSPTENKPAIIDISPDSVEDLDVSEPLAIRFTLNMEAKQSIGGSGILAVLKDPTGKEFRPSSIFFERPDLVTVLWRKYTLDWYTTYKLSIYPELLHCKSDNLAFRLATGHQNYNTASCGCEATFDGSSFSSVCAVGGACSCREKNGETCSNCPQGSKWITKSLGSAGHTKEFQICDAPTPSAPPMFTSPPTGQVDYSHRPDDHHPKTLPPGRFTYPPVVNPPTWPSEQSGEPQPPNPTSVTPVAKSPPLRFLRVGMSYFVLFVLAMYSFFALRAYVKRRPSHNFSNPFRAAATGGSLQRSSGAQDDDDDADENDAIVGESNA